MKSENFKSRLTLTEREHQILSLLCQKVTDSAEIAKRLFIARSTVKNNLSIIYLKLNVNDKTQAVIEAIKMGLVDKGIIG